jgi:hypothetical protein
MNDHKEKRVRLACPTILFKIGLGWSRLDSIEDIEGYACQAAGDFAGLKKKFS